MTTYGLVLTAAGSSRRFGGDTSKVLLLLGGVPVVARAAAAFRAALGTLPPSSPPAPTTSRPSRARPPRPRPRRRRRRRGRRHPPESVARGVGASRPASTSSSSTTPPAPRHPDLIRRVADAAATAPPPRAPVRDSVHRADAAGRLVETLDRDALRTVQTPQAARADVLRRALDLAEQRGTVATDEFALLVAAGFPVTAVAGDPDNVKLTVPADLTFARNVLEARRDFDAADDVVPR
jgi:2-C-methyl-D-erythritol 4-phosphate cytidylyltransferase